jgi:hypothetical protein
MSPPGHSQLFASSWDPGRERVFHMRDPNESPAHQYADHIEAILHTGLPVTVDPDRRRMRQVPPLLPADGPDWPAKATALTSLHLDERHCMCTPDNEIDVSVPDTKPTRQHVPAPSTHPPLGE